MSTKELDPPKQDWTKVKLEPIEGEENGFYFRDGDFKSLPLFYHVVKPTKTVGPFSKGQFGIYLRDPSYGTNIGGDTLDIVQRVERNPDLGIEIANTWLQHVDRFTYYIQFEFDESRRKPIQLNRHTQLLTLISDSLLSIECGSLGELFDALLRIEDAYQDYRIDTNREANYAEHEKRLADARQIWERCWLESQRVVERIKNALESRQRIESANVQTVYERILSVLQQMGDEMERKPALYNDKDEEGLRDYLLAVLSLNFDSATGETFNRTGRTDILVRHEARYACVAECKFWSGKKNYFDTIDQLFGYLTWRDSQTAVVLFVPNKELSGVLKSIEEETPKHACFVKDNGKVKDGWYSYTFCSPDDRNRQVSVAVLVFHFPE